MTLDCAISMVSRRGGARGGVPVASVSERVHVNNAFRSIEHAIYVSVARLRPARRSMKVSTDRVVAAGSCSEKAQHQNMVFTVTFWCEYGLSEGLHKKMRCSLALGRRPKATGSKFNVQYVEPFLILSAMNLE